MYVGIDIIFTVYNIVLFFVGNLQICWEPSMQDVHVPALGKRSLLPQIVAANFIAHDPLHPRSLT